MKNVVILAVILMLFGCVAQPVPEGNETVEDITNITPAEEQPVVEEEKIVETFAIESDNGIFRHTDYEFADNSNPFSDGAGGDLGKTSTAYIKVDEEDLDFLSGTCENEKQAFWFNLKTKDEKGVVFEAIYSVDLEGNCERIKLLGKAYEIETVEKPESEEGKIVRGGEIRLKEADSQAAITLRDGSGFNRDDRWPVVLGWKEDKLVKIIVYMGGYFYDVEADTANVPLFGAGNSVLARFTNMDTNPAFELITTDTTAVKKLAEEKDAAASEQVMQEVDSYFIMEDIATRKNHTAHKIVNASGIYITFQEPLRIYNSVYGMENEDKEERNDQHRLIIPLSGENYAISCLEFDNGTNSSYVCLGREEQNEIMHGYYCGEYYQPTHIDVSGEKIGFVDLSFNNGNVTAIMCRLSDNETCEKEDWFSVRAHENFMLSDGSILRIWLYQPCAYTLCNRYVSISYLSEEITLEDNADGIELNWTTAKLYGREREMETPALKSIYIPSNSSAYEKLTK